MIRYLNNLRIKQKFFVIYLLCVMIPIILTNTMMFLSIKSHLEENQRKDMLLTTERVEFSIENLLQEVVKVSDYIYTDRRVDEFLQTDYASQSDYYTSFFDIKMNHNFRSYFSSGTIQKIEMYTDNPTIINGGYFWDLEAVQSTEWYRLFKERGDTSLIEFYDTELYVPPSSDKSRKISFVKKLDYSTTDGYQTILKIDLNYNKLLKVASDGSQTGDILLASNQKVLLNNKGVKQVYRDMPVIDEAAMQEPFVKRSFYAIDNIWDIYVLANPVSVFSSLRENSLLLVLLIVFNFLLPTACLIILNKSFRDRLKTTEDHILNMKEGDFRKVDITEGNDEIGDLIRTYNYMVVKLTELINDIYEKSVEQQALELAKKQTELVALQSQINPHFIYNVLDGIRMNCYIKGETESGKMIEDLALLLRRMMKWDQNHFISIEEELFYVEKYLSIQKYRFSDRLHYNIYVEEECKRAKIPKLSITTFVENACIHGIERKVSGGYINISITEVNGRLLIEILDSGAGMHTDHLNFLQEKIKRAEFKELHTENSTGILNAYLRVNAYYQEDVSLKIRSEVNEGTEIVLELPFL